MIPSALVLLHLTEGRPCQCFIISFRLTGAWPSHVTGRSQRITVCAALVPAGSIQKQVLQAQGCSCPDPPAQDCQAAALSKLYPAYLRTVLVFFPPLLPHLKLLFLTSHCNTYQRVYPSPPAQRPSPQTGKSLMMGVEVAACSQLINLSQTSAAG